LQSSDAGRKKTAKTFRPRSIVVLTVQPCIHIKLDETQSDRIAWCTVGCQLAKMSSDVDGLVCQLNHVTA